MKHIITAVLLSCGLAFAAQAQTSAFTYQGSLNDGANMAHGTYDLTFALFSDSSGASRAGATLTNTATAVSNGLFAVTLDFGHQFPGANRWLEIAVRTNGGEAYQILTPRQQITATPYAITAGNLSGTLPAAQVNGVLSSANLGGTYGGEVKFDNGGNSFSGNGGGLTNLNASQLGSGTVPDATLASNVARRNQVWLLGGNAEADPANGAFLGTTDTNALEFKANAQRALRIEYATNSTFNQSPNLVGGYSGNVVSNGFVGAVIGGGGNAVLQNRVGHHFAAVVGGIGNTASGFASTAMGNRNVASGGGSTAMGYFVTSSGLFSTAMGYATTASGYLSTASGEFTRATSHAAVAMGVGTEASGDTSVAMGDRAKAFHDGAFVWADPQDADFASTATNQFLILAQGGVGINTSSPGDAALAVNGRVSILGANVLELGAGVAGKEFSAGRIGFQTFTADALDIVGAGTTGLNRKIKFWGEGGSTFTGPASLGSTLGQKLNLYSTTFGLGIQSGILYSRVALGGGFAWYASGFHNDNTYNSGGGTTLMKLDGSGLTVNGTFVSSSDRNVKENFAPVQPREVLEKVLALPLSRWNYKADPATRHVGPMAQDFYAAFNLDADDKHIATVDADGVALAAIQGLN